MIGGLLLIATTLHADEIRGKVVSIADGDTITVLDAGNVQHKIRLEGIDAPEKGQAFGTKSENGNFCFLSCNDTFHVPGKLQ